MTDQIKGILEEMEATKTELSYASRINYIMSKWEVGKLLNELEKLTELNIPNLSLLLKWSANEIERCLIFYRNNPDWEAWLSYTTKNITWTQIRKQIDEENNINTDHFSRFI